MLRCKVNVDLGLSDHNTLFLNIPVRLPKLSNNKNLPLPKTIICSNEKINCFVNLLRYELSNNFHPAMRINDNYNNFLSSLLSLVNSGFPLKTVKNMPKGNPVVPNRVTREIKAPAKESGNCIANQILTSPYNT